MPTATLHTKPQPLWFIDNLAFVHIDGDQTGGAYGLGEVSGRRGDMPPLHVHHSDDEAFYVLVGELTLFVGEEQITLRTGEAVLAPHDIPHVYRVESEQARWLVIGSPAGFEQLVRAAADPAPEAVMPPTGRPFDPDTFAQLAAQYGVEILGPPGTLPAVA